MTKDEALDIVRRVADAFANGNCSNLPTMAEIEEAAAVLAKIAGETKPEIERDPKGVAVLTKKLADYLKDLAAAANAKECRDILISQLPDLEDKLPSPARRM